MELITKEDFIKELNGDLSMEYRSIIQYIQHIATVNGARYQQTLEELEERHLKRYRERVAQTVKLNLPDVAEATAPLLEETQEHVRDLRAVLDT